MIHARRNLSEGKQHGQMVYFMRLCLLDRKRRQKRSLGFIKNLERRKKANVKNRKDPFSVRIERVFIKDFAICNFDVPEI